VFWFFELFFLSHYPITILLLFYPMLSYPKPILNLSWPNLTGPNRPLSLFFHTQTLPGYSYVFSVFSKFWKIDIKNTRGAVFKFFIALTTWPKLTWLNWPFYLLFHSLTSLWGWSWQNLEGTFFKGTNCPQLRSDYFVLEWKRTFRYRSQAWARIRQQHNLGKLLWYLNWKALLK
jgi:hypothetical protein